MTTEPAPATVDSMATYYAKRAAIYERVYLKPERQTDLRTMETALAEPFAGRHVLEIACGTGWWTPHGAARAAHWRATDLNPETFALAQAKPAMPACVRFQTVDAYTFSELGDETFDAAFAGCWWSHVPLARLPAWLATLHARLVPGAVVTMIDGRRVADVVDAARLISTHLPGEKVRLDFLVRQQRGLMVTLRQDAVELPVR